MFVCEGCKTRMHSEEDVGTGRPFPAFSVAAGVLGSLAAVATGAILLVPAAVVLGAVADTRRCGLCGAEVSKDEPAYHMMHELPGESGSPAYRPVQRPPQSATPQPDLGRPIQGRAPQGRSMEGPSRQSGPASLFDSPEQPKEAKVQADLTFDEVKGGLVPRESPAVPEDVASDPEVAPLASADLMPELTSPLFDEALSDPFGDLESGLGFGSGDEGAPGELPSEGGGL